MLQITGALRGYTPYNRVKINADMNGDGLISYFEAFMHAEKQPLTGRTDNRGKPLRTSDGDEVKPSKPAAFFRNNDILWADLIPCIDTQKKNYFSQIELLAQELERSGAFDAARELRLKIRDSEKGFD